MRLAFWMVLLACLVAPARAQTSLQLSSQSVVPGQAVTLQLNLIAPANSQVAGAQWTFAYSDTDFSALSVSTGPAAVAAGKSVSCNGGSGLMICVVIGINTNTIASGVIATATFTASATTHNASSAVQILNSLGTTPQGAALAVAAAGGTITITRPLIQPASLSCSPISIATPGTSTCTVTLTAAALTDGASVTLSSNNTAVSVPPSVNVAAGSSSASFTAAALAVTSSATSTVTAGLNGSSRTFTLGLTAPAGGLAPSIQTNPGALNFTAAAGSAPPPQNLMLTDTGARLQFTASSSASWLIVTPPSGIAPTGITVSINAAGLAPGTYDGRVVIDTPGATAGPVDVPVTLSVVGDGLRLIPVPACRVADTREETGKQGWTGNRDFVIANRCQVPADASAYLLNVTAIPRRASLGVLAMWPSGRPQPVVSTLNSYDGRVKANAAIVSAGVNGAVRVSVSDIADVLLDVSGYFMPAGKAPMGLVYHPITACRVADTRAATDKLGFAGLQTFVITRMCGVPGTAQAYAMNFTVIPRTASFGFLAAWPAELPMPGVSLLNAFTGTVTSNSSIVPSGLISVYQTDSADLIADVNGYFEPPGADGLSFYPVSPCRAVDTREATNKQGFAGPQEFSMPAGACGLPVASAYWLNATVIPRPALDFLTLWPTGGKQPPVSTLNAFDGSVVSNAAIIPADAAGSVTAYHTQAADLLLDVSGFFAP